MKNKSNPNHVAIIMDGNGRWAKNNNKTRLEGHKNGVKTLKKIIQKSLDLKINKLTLYTFSKDNWNRPRREIQGLMKLFSNTIKKEFDNLNENGVNISFVGDFSGFSKTMIDLINHTSSKTKSNSSLELNIALGYSGRQEIIYATKNIVNKIVKKQLDIDDIDCKIFSENLYDSNKNDPDLLIRTGGESRVSDFMLWQIAYSEIFFTKKYWPDFNEDDFLFAINDYKYRERRYGKISEQLK